MRKELIFLTWEQRDLELLLRDSGFVVTVMGPGQGEPSEDEVRILREIIDRLGI